MFTYNAAAPASDLDKLRLYIGDTVEDAGPRVGGRNYSDGELSLFLTAGGSWSAAVGLALEALATEWSTAARSIKYQQYAEDFTQQAAELRIQAARWQSTRAADGSLLPQTGAGAVVLNWWETLS